MPVKILNVSVLYCYRYPPKTMLLNAGQAASVFPAVNAAMWCGEFVERGA